MFSEQDIRNIFQQMNGGSFTMHQPTTRDWRIKIYLGEDIVQEQKATMDDMSAFNNYRNTAMQLYRDSRPLKCVFEYDYFKWDGSVLHVDSASYENQAYVRWTNEPKKDEENA